MSSAVVVLGLLALAGFVAFVIGVPIPGLSHSPQETYAREPPPPNVQLVAGREHSLSVPEDVRAALGIRKGGKDELVTAEKPTAGWPLILSGSTALDPTRLMRIRARFAPAEVTEIMGNRDSSMGDTQKRELRPGDKVEAKQPLAVLYSVDVGTRKNDLVDAIVQLKLDQEILDASEAAYNRSALSRLDLLAARRSVQADHNAINRAINTLRAWDVPPEDIQAVENEAREMIKQGAKREWKADELDERVKAWARVVLRAPEAGTIVERNITEHEVVTDATTNLFQIARVDPLTVVVNAAEDDLPKLQELLKNGPRPWKVRTVGSDQDIVGTLETVSYLIDVNQHSVVVKGHVPNKGDQLRAGQYVTAIIDTDRPDDVVEVPMSAVVDDGKQTVVFVRPDPKRPDVFTMRRVKVTQRFDRRIGQTQQADQRVYVRSHFDGDKDELPPEAEGLLPRRVLKPGDQVITAGVLELKKELEDREGEAAPKD